MFKDRIFEAQTKGFMEKFDKMQKENLDAASKRMDDRIEAVGVAFERAIDGRVREIVYEVLKEEKLIHGTEKAPTD